ncbi:transmembrane protein, partial [Perilla frutescens var. frutescens]
MSGVSVAVPPSRIDEAATTAAAAKTTKPASEGGVMGSLRVIELQLVAFIMIFSVSGLVPLLDLVFPAAVTAYLLALSRLVFPTVGKGGDQSPEIFQGSRLFRAYVIAGTTVGLFLPLAYVLGGFARGDDHAVRSATPHLFLLSFQILTENIISGMSLFSPPVRALVPLLYTVRRIFVIVDWMNDVWLNKTLPANAPFSDVGWYWFGRCLALMNLGYFATNLFCFLIPRFLPLAFERYFRGRDETQAKLAHDKNKNKNNE